MSSGKVFEFAKFRMDVPKRLLFREGQAVALVPKAFDTLAFLVQHRDRVVTKDEVMQAVWPDTFVEEANLTQNISVVRKALGESPKDHRFIVTVPGRGYRFAAEVHEPLPVHESSQACQLYLKGRHFLNKRLTPSLHQAITCFRQSTDEDPTYAPAWVGLADAYALLSLYGASMPRDVFPKSKAAAETALRLDPAMAEAHNSLGVVELFYEWHWAGAEQALTRAIELNPAYGDAHQRYGILMTARGRFAEAKAALQRAQEADPLSRIIATIAGYPYYYGRDYAGAVRQYRLVIETAPEFSMAHFRLGHELSKKLSNDRDVVAALGRVHAMTGDRAAAEAAIAELHERSKDTFVSPYALATIYAALGDTGEAITQLEKAFDDRSYWIIYLNVDPALDALRHLPAFDAIRHKARL
jgi:DNA-binding winged helix-turn-helix (wHTH) protein/Flp pilus assembly protein TadD